MKSYPLFLRLLLYELGDVGYIAKPFNNAIVKVRIKTQLKILEQMRNY